jgi:ketosteroid isomerase-like protein
MKHGLLASLAFLTVSFLLVCPPIYPASSAIDPVAAEAAVRKADADWTIAASTGSADAWMSFYAPDAIVLLPHDQVASGEELVRQAVTRLLALPHLTVVWRPIEAKVARSGDLAFLTGGYELRFDDLHGAPVSDRDRRIEIWRKQADGSWKCVVDTWNLDESVGEAPLARTESPLPALAPESGPPAPARETATKYGDMPTNYEEAIRKYFLEHLKHPESVQYREITKPEQGYTTEVTGGLLMREKREYGWTVKATINAKNSHDSYVGFKTYTFLFRADKIVDARLPLPGDEMN